MSGAGSRARRVEAEQRARSDVYASLGAEMSAVPFDDDRMARLYVKAYASYLQQYRNHDALDRELREAYGHAGAPVIYRAKA